MKLSAALRHLSPFHKKDPRDSKHQKSKSSTSLLRSDAVATRARNTRHLPSQSEFSFMEFGELLLPENSIQQHTKRLSSENGSVKPINSAPMITTHDTMNLPQDNSISQIADLPAAVGGRRPSTEMLSPAPRNSSLTNTERSKENNMGSHPRLTTKNAQPENIMDILGKSTSGDNPERRIVSIQTVLSDQSSVTVKHNPSKRSRKAITVTRSSVDDGKSPFSDRNAVEHSSADSGEGDSIAISGPSKRRSTNITSESCDIVPCEEPNLPTIRRYSEAASFGHLIGTSYSSNDISRRIMVDSNIARRSLIQSRAFVRLVIAAQNAGIEFDKPSSDLFPTAGEDEYRKN